VEAAFDVVAVEAAVEVVALEAAVDVVAVDVADAPPQPASIVQTIAALTIVAKILFFISFLLISYDIN